MQNKHLFTIIVAVFVVFLSFHAQAARPSKKKIRVAMQSYVPPTVVITGNIGVRRNLMMIQDDFNEFNGMISACTLSLLRALQAESAPILVSSSLWFNTCLYLWRHGDEHFLKPRRKQWKLYRVDGDIYLAMPRHYEEAMKTLASRCSTESPAKDMMSAKPLTQLDLAMGLKISCLQEIENPFSVGWDRTINYRLRMVGAPFSTGPDINERILKTVFLTKADVANVNQLPPWEIYLVGHGRGKMGVFSSVIGGFSIKDFRMLLKFMNDQIPMRLFMYQTCYGGGEHLWVPYRTDDKPDIYNYTIICCCAMSSPSTILFDPKSKHNTDFKEIFKEIMTPVLDDHDKRLAAFYPCPDEAPKKRVLHNIPSIRRPFSTDFVALTQSQCESPLQIYKPGLASDTELVVENKQALLLYDQGVIHVPIIMKGSCAAFIQMEPTSDIVVINRLEAHDQLFKDILTYTFAPVSMFKTPDGTFLVKELICKVDEQDELPRTFHNVLIRSKSLTALLETPYEQFLESKYLYNFMLRKRVTYECGGKVYRVTIKPAHGPDYLGKVLMVFDAFINGVYNLPASWSNIWAYAQDLQPKKMWTLTKSRRLNAPQSKHFHELFTNTYETLSAQIEERRDQILADAQKIQDADSASVVAPECQFIAQ